jgi:hypothetical protein
MPGMKIIQDEVEKDVTLMKDVDVEFVSLVRHGANRMPFRVVKRDKSKGGETMNRVIQSVILPDGVTLDSLTEVEGLEYLSELDMSDKQKFEGYQKFVQLKQENFQSESMSLLKAGRGFLIVGSLNDENKEKAEKALTISKDQVSKLGELIPVAPMDAMIGDPDTAAQAAYAVSFRNLFDNELYSMLDIVHGALNQTSSDPKKRKVMITSAIENFKSFIVIGLDAIGSQAVKMDKDVSALLKKDGGKEDMFEFKDENEFKDKVGEIISDQLAPVTEGIQTLTSKLEEIDKLPKEPAKDESTDTNTDRDTKDKDDQKKDEVSELKDMVEKLTSSVTELTKKHDTLENQLEGDPSDNDTQDITDPNKRKKGENTSVFKNLLTRAAA